MEKRAATEYDPMANDATFRRKKLSNVDGVNDLGCTVTADSSSESRSPTVGTPIGVTPDSSNLFVVHPRFSFR
ncbi:hypothetical protein [Natronolimnohabitans innermongolicus]|uniref:Uncharacterized protein n=1 Tax=Natronolimnohabitans innermongolicus JCM 12255 TaxID=1227499 RepID=L9WGN2_9EURY|nr:hypothetical protein [Natronolimnohabitans innermongolicus]ELY48609.1 hypothetical protein C493_21861 [Natronolimnohabitans innermongolicus JCM 12255]